MLILTRGVGEPLMVGDEVTVTIGVSPTRRVRISIPFSLRITVQDSNSLQKIKGLQLRPVDPALT